MESLGKNELTQTECQIQNTHDTKMQKIKDAEKYYQQAILGTMNLTFGIILIGSLLIKKVLSQS